MPRVRDLLLFSALCGGFLLSCPACEREPLDLFCPSIGSGELAISEIRGPQSNTTDALGQWIEIHNPNDRPVSVTGLSLRMAKLDGSGERRIVVREGDLEVEAYGYFVLGRFDADDLPAHVDYGFAADFNGDLYNTGFLRLEACETLIDQVIWGQGDNAASAPALPSRGSLSFDGAEILTAEANDLGDNWCYDQVDDGIHQAGTPKEMNRACEP